MHAALLRSRRFHDYPRLARSRRTVAAAAARATRWTSPPRAPARRRARSRCDGSTRSGSCSAA